MAARSDAADASAQTGVSSGPIIASSKSESGSSLTTRRSSTTGSSAAPAPGSTAGCSSSATLCASGPGPTEDDIARSESTPNSHSSIPSPIFASPSRAGQTEPSVRVIQLAVGAQSCAASARVMASATAQYSSGYPVAKNDNAPETVSGCTASSTSSLSGGSSPSVPIASLRLAYIAVSRTQAAWMTARRATQHMRRTRSVDIALRRLHAAFEQLCDSPVPPSSAALLPRPLILQYQPSLSGPHTIPTFLVPESSTRASASSDATTLASSELHSRPFTARPFFPSAVPLQSPPAYILAPLHALHHILDTIAFESFNSSLAYTNINHQLRLPSPSPFLAPLCSALSPIPFH
ncbi:hypothetical protein CF336_g6604 [Tilletia laevis]|nr:hypothetical protein CF336_g6604 [Tilletia laevis]KAE8193448.1 hypothetical protein CF335_g5588 [Tilletia laevis]